MRSPRKISQPWWGRFSARAKEVVGPCGDSSEDSREISRVYYGLYALPSDTRTGAEALCYWDSRGGDGRGSRVTKSRRYPVSTHGGRGPCWGHEDGYPDKKQPLGYPLRAHAISITCSPQFASHVASLPNPKTTTERLSREQPSLLSVMSTLSRSTS